MSLNLTDLRLRLRVAARNGGDTHLYTNAALDTALEGLFTHFLRETRVVKTTTTLAIDDDTNEADFSALSGFLVSRVERARVRDDKQVIELTDATGGTFTLTYDDQETGTIAYDATAATVQSALEALSNLAVGEVTVSGDAGGPYTVQFPTFQPEDIEALEADGASLTPATATIEVTALTFDIEEDLNITSAADVLKAIAQDPAEGSPEDMAFIDSTTAKFYPRPSNAGTLEVTYSPLQTPWTMGTMGAWSATVSYSEYDVVSSGGNLYRSLTNQNVNHAVSDTTYWENLGAGTLVAPANITSTIPDGLVTEIIRTGGAAMLQATDPQHQSFIGPAFAAYLSFQQRCMGIGSIAGKRSRQESLR